MSQVNTNAIYDASGGQSAKLYGVSMRNGGTGWVNRIINGDMRIDQRNAGASVTPAVTFATFAVDRWANYGSQNSKLTAQRNGGAVTPPSGFTNYYGITSSSAYAVLSTDYFILQQNIEGFNVADLGWGSAAAQTVTLSFWVRSSLTGTFGGSLRNNGDNRSYPFTYTISAANTWEQKTITVVGDTTGTWATDNSTGIRVCFGLGAGSSFSGTAGSWTGTSNVFSVTGATSVVGTNGATFYITGVQLEAGSVASPFERRPFGTELALCQRYYEQSFVGATPVTAGGIIQNYNASGSINTAALQVIFKVTKRVAPTVISFSPTTGSSGVIRDGSGADRTATVQYVNTSSAHITNAAVGNISNYSAQYTASAEL